MSASEATPQPSIPTETSGPNRLLSDRLIKVERSTGSLCFHWKLGESFELPTSFLRAGSPSAENTAYSKTYLEVEVLRKAHERYQSVGIVSVEPVGNYALRLQFSDGHRTGLFSFEHLKKLKQIYDQHFL